MKKELELGTLASGKNFTLPLDLVTRTLAIIGIRGSGKTTAATVLAEEMCEAGLPWVAIDRAGVWWGLRCALDGGPGGYPVVILGGEHADLPLEKGLGAKYAEAILEQNVSCVIDVSRESKNVWRHFTTEFAQRLMELRPETPRMIFLEESPQLVPQRPLGEEKRTLGAVKDLFELGRNNGYGGTLISQRFATVNKDVLTQSENLLAFRSIGKPDRDACRDWIAEVISETESEKKAEEFFRSLASLESGEGWFWSPEWLNVFSKIRIRRRKTYHPGETRRVGVAPKQVALSDVKEFVEQFRKVLAQDRAVEKKQITVKAGQSSIAMASGAYQSLHSPNREAELEAENARLREKCSTLERELAQSVSRLMAVREYMEPQYRSLQKLFGDLEITKRACGASLDAAVFEAWKLKLGKGPARMIDALLERGELTRNQIATLTGLSPRSGSFSNYLARLNTNGLIEKDGEKIRLRFP